MRPSRPITRGRWGKEAGPPGRGLTARQMTRVPLPTGVSLNVTELPQAARRRHPGLPIVMIHGLAASSAFWHAAGAPFLSVLGPCIAYDLRGHGKSTRPETGYGACDMALDLKALLRARGIERAHLVAHSFGGMVALAFTLHHPERVASLTLVDVRIRPLQERVSVASTRVPPGIRRRLEALGIDPDTLAIADDGIAYLASVARIQAAAGKEAGELLRALYRHGELFRTVRAARSWLELTEQATLIRDIREERAFEAEDLRRLRLPLLIMVGGRSTTRPSAEALAALRPDAHLRVVPDVGHFFPISEPRLFLRPTLRFLHQTGRGGAPRPPLSGK